ncbi:MAG: hypothetical protein ABIW82_18725 [Dokdonella sp.]
MDTHGATKPTLWFLPLKMMKSIHSGIHRSCWVIREVHSFFGAFSRLVLSLLRHTQSVLDPCVAHDYPCIGILMALENACFGESMRNPVWMSTAFVCACKSGRGLDLRV